MTNLLLKGLVCIVVIGCSAIEIAAVPVRYGVLDLQQTRIHVDALLKGGNYLAAEKVLFKLRELHPDDEDIIRKILWAFEGSQQPNSILQSY